ncbi:hypothetical protein SK128_016535 [Halocaridina rubra]|uniref:NACHT domain-containing protein n=1 Tax=Halocaridina rubra TaxID=373956 RepID=A0AAN8WBL4_HALRR
MSYSRKDLEFGKLLKFIHVEGKNVMITVSRAIYKSQGNKSKNGRMPLKNFMEKYKISDIFDKECDALLARNILESDYDITFAYKFIQNICKDTYEQLTEHCKKQIRYLVQFRNEMSHKYVLENESFETQYRYLKGVFEDIYKGVAKTLNKGKNKGRINFDNEIHNMRESLKELLNVEITIADANSYIEDFRNNLLLKVMEAGKCDLSIRYSKLRVLNPCSWIQEYDEPERFKLETIFTEPYLSSDQCEIAVKDILTTSSKTAVILQGESGSGKTTFCYFLIHAWMTRPKVIQGLEDYRLVVLVELGRTTSKTVLQYLKEELIRGAFKEALDDDVMKILGELDILFIIDGYDESERKATLLKDILEKFGKKKIIITTRTVLKEELLGVVKQCKISSLVADLKGFVNKSYQVNYIEKVFTGVNRDKEGFLRYLNGRGKVLGEHLRLPLSLAFLIVLWMDDPKNVNSVTTGTSLYKELFCCFLKKLMVRLKGQGKYEGASNEKVLEILNKILFLLGKEAWDMLQQGRDVDFPNSKEFERECRKVKLDPVEFLSAFLLCSINEDSDCRDCKFYFMHKTQTEYLASYYIVHSVKKEDNLIMKLENIQDWKRYDQLLIYLTGNLALNDNLSGREKDIVHFVNETKILENNYTYLWHIVSESRIELKYPEAEGESIKYTKLVHNEIGKLIAQKLEGHTSWHPDSQSTAAALRLISLIPVHIEALDIVIPEDEEPYDIPDFIEAIEEVQDHYKYKKLSTELCLWKHESYGCENTSDRFLKAMERWADLKKFIGSLESVYCFKKNYPNLKNIRCKITSPEVLHSFKRLRSSVRALRISLKNLPDQCVQGDIPYLDYSGCLELTFHHINNDNLMQMYNFAHQLSGKYGCKSVCLKNSHISYDTLEQSIKFLNKLIAKTLEISCPDEVNDDRKMDLKSKAIFKIDWIHM